MSNTTIARLAVLIGLAACTAAHAQNETPFPTRPVQMVIPWAVGGSVDTMGRALAMGMGKALGQSFAVVNRDGAAGMVGTGAVGASAPDGYTLTFGPITPITNAAQLMKKPPFNADSFEYVCQVFENRFSISVPESSPYKTINELFDAMKSKPGQLTYGQLGNGSISHLSMETAIRGRDIKVTPVPYRGEAPMFIDLRSGRLDAGIVTIGGVLMSSQPVRILAVIGDRRHPGAPDVPTLKELGIPTLLPALNGLMAPKGTPAPVLRKLETACKEASASEEMKAATHALREQVLFLPRAEFTERVKRDYQEKGQLIKELNLTID